MYCLRSHVRAQTFGVISFPALIIPVSFEVIDEKLKLEERSTTNLAGSGELYSWKNTDYIWLQDDIIRMPT